MLSLKEIQEEMSSLVGWSLDGSSLVKDFSFADFKVALEFVNKVGAVCEENNHHANIMINYDKVRLVLTTHSINALTKRDFTVAKEIDAV